MTGPLPEIVKCSEWSKLQAGQRVAYSSPYLLRLVGHNRKKSTLLQITTKKMIPIGNNYRS